MPTVTADQLYGDHAYDATLTGTVTVTAAALSDDYAIYGQIGTPLVAFARGYLLDSPYTADLLR